jgi:hypothetical protein
VRIEVLHLLVESVEHLSGITAEKCVGAQRATQPAHHLRGGKAAPDHVVDHDAQPVAGKDEHGIPVAADPTVLCGNVAGCHLQVRHHRQPGRQQAALQHRRCSPFDLEPTGLDRETPGRP